MADDADIRRSNFRAWAEKVSGGAFSPASVAGVLGRTPQLSSDLYHGRKSFGEKLARYIEDKAQLRRMSLDDVAGAQPSPLPADVLEALAAQTAETRRMVENMIRGALKMPLADEDEMPLFARAGSATVDADC